MTCSHWCTAAASSRFWSPGAFFRNSATTPALWDTDKSCEHVHSFCFYVLVQDVGRAVDPRTAGYIIVLVFPAQRIVPRGEIDPPGRM